MRAALQLADQGLKDPEDSINLRQRAAANNFWAQHLLRTGRPDEALATARKVVSWFEPILGSDTELPLIHRLTEAHPSVKVGRNIGLFGMSDIQKNSKGELIAPYNGTHPAMKALGAYFREQGLFSFSGIRAKRHKLSKLIQEASIGWNLLTTMAVLTGIVSVL